ncbi:hypothetical protein [Thermoanaerobacter kivui]|uniref:hypothetical protein n=1 Tax=Thermoanaerobacter kivui TaxID=2325 RepID=UPI0011DD0060
MTVQAPQAPGKEDAWASAQKQGIGTANNDVSKMTGGNPYIFLLYNGIIIMGKRRRLNCTT